MHVLLQLSGLTPTYEFAYAKGDCRTTYIDDINVSKIFSPAIKDKGPAKMRGAVKTTGSFMAWLSPPSHEEIKGVTHKSAGVNSAIKVGSLFSKHLSLCFLTVWSGFYSLNCFLLVVLDKLSATVTHQILARAGMLNYLDCDWPSLC